MAIETVPFDASEFLGSIESQAELLADAFESGDAGYITHALGVVARARGMTGIAKEASVAREALSGDGDPKLTTPASIERAG
jgi:probable addiction module antidote protein